MNIIRTAIRTSKTAAGLIALAVTVMLFGSVAEAGGDATDEVELGAAPSSYADGQGAGSGEQNGEIHLGSVMGNPVTSGDTTEWSDFYTPSCMDENFAPDAWYTWTAPYSADFEFDTAGSEFDTVLEIRSYSDGSSLGCNDDAGDGTLQSFVSVSLLAGETVLVIIDGFDTDAGFYQLNIND